MFMLNKASPSRRAPSRRARRTLWSQIRIFWSAKYEYLINICAFITGL